MALTPEDVILRHLYRFEYFDNPWSGTLLRPMRQKTTEVFTCEMIRRGPALHGTVTADVGEEFDCWYGYFAGSPLSGNYGKEDDV